jgi:DNA repair exonuclease SbcCD nuclease subunit
MKFLHTADWQIGMKYSRTGEVGTRLREERINSLRVLVDIAQAHGAEFILVAGDMFEDNGVERVLVQKVADILAAAGMPVFVIPGNHDPFVPGSVWEQPAWRAASNVQVLSEERPVELPGGLLYPCPAREKYSDRDPTAWIHARETGGIKIGVAHGTVEGVCQEVPEYPVPRNTAERAGLDYLALGHWHSLATYPGRDGIVRMAYSGTHETTKFGERDSGNVLLVEIEDGGAAPVLTAVPTGRLKWMVIEKDIRETRDIAEVRAQVESVENPGMTLVDMCLTGLLAAESQDEISHIREILEARFLFNRIDISRLRPAPEDENWITVLPAGVIREAGIRLQELADSAFAGKRPEGTSPEIAARALIELYAIVSEETR